MSSDWSIAIAQPLQERRALVNLAQQGFECYAPRMLARVRKTQGKISRVLMQPAYLFGRYFFVRFSEHWRAITGTRGVHSLLINASGTLPLLLRNADVDRLRSREGADGLIRMRGNAKLAFNAGDKARVNEGQFSGLEGIVEMSSVDDRVAVLLSMMGRKVRVEMEAADLTLA